MFTRLSSINQEENKDQSLDRSTRVTILPTSESKPTKYPCTFEGCQRIYSRRSSRNLHLRGFHYGNNFECSFESCGKMFSEKGNLLVHMRTHTGEKPFSCQYCGKIFTSNGNCRDHLRRHISFKPYKCQQCDKSYYRKYQLKDHCFKKHIVDTSQIQTSSKAQKISLMNEQSMSNKHKLQGQLNPDIGETLVKEQSSTSLTEQIQKDGQGQNEQINNDIIVHLCENSTKQQQQYYQQEAIPEKATSDEFKNSNHEIFTDIESPQYTTQISSRNYYSDNFQDTLTLESTMVPTFDYFFAQIQDIQNSDIYKQKELKFKSNEKADLDMIRYDQYGLDIDLKKIE